MFGRTLETLDRLFHTANDVRVRGVRRRASRRFTPSLRVGGPGDAAELVEHGGGIWEART